MKHRITVSKLSGSEAIASPVRILMKKSVQAALDSEGVRSKCEVNVLYTDDGGIRKLNKDTRGMDKATDVLSFPLIELSPGQNPPEPSGGADAVWLGDIVVSLQRLKSQALEYGHSEEREAAFLVVHACLHLLGYDHEQGKEQEKLMFEKTENILSGMGLSRTQT
jgi:probable rRNA maturation factor